MYIEPVSSMPLLYLSDILASFKSSCILILSFDNHVPLILHLNLM